jgi:predicted metal-dependent enzyme (double-stranded beta helix superfamily)
VKQLLDRALSRPSEIDDALGVPDHGGIRTIHRSDELTVLQLVWPPHVHLFPHDHQMWAANGIYGGREDNTFYRRTADGLVASGGKQLGSGESVLLGSEAIHAVVNPSDSFAAALHVYGGDFFATPRSQWDPESLEESPFDIEAVKAILAQEPAG